MDIRCTSEHPSQDRRALFSDYLAVRVRQALCRSLSRARRRRRRRGRTRDEEEPLSHCPREISNASAGNLAQACREGRPRASAGGCRYQLPLPPGGIEGRKGSAQRWWRQTSTEIVTAARIMRRAWQGRIRRHGTAQRGRLRIHAFVVQLCL